MKNILNAFVITTVFVVLVNICIDPGRLFVRNHKDIDAAQLNLATMKATPFGIKLPSTNQQRHLKFLFANEPAECAILASSRGGEISLLRKSSLENVCSTMHNLWVPSGDIHDLVTYGVRLAETETSKILIVLDHWTFDDRARHQWRAIEEQYVAAAKNLGLEEKMAERQPQYELLTAAFSFSYFTSALSMLYKSIPKPHLIYEQTPPVVFDAIPAVDTPILRGDGSLMWKKSIYEYTDLQYFEKNPNRRFPRSYKIRPAAVKRFEALLSHLKSHDKQVIFVKIPYHPEVFSRFPKRVDRYLTPVDELIDKIATNHEIPVVGTYDSRTLGCKANEFRDPYHSLARCIDRIDYKPAAPKLRPHN